MNSLIRESDDFGFITDDGSARKALQQWRDKLLEGAHKVANTQIQFQIEELGLRIQASPTDDNVKLGWPTVGDDWTVGLNLRARSGDSNQLTDVGVDRSGKRWILRQGRLHYNKKNPRHILGRDFIRHFGRKRIVITCQLERPWYRVAQVDATPETVQNETADFTEQCERLRKFIAEQN